MPDDSIPARFPTTRFSAVLGVRSSDEPERRRSWEALLAAYDKPVYKHVRVRWKKSRQDAEDLTQAFFVRAMEDDFFASYEPERARFRTFLRTCLDRFVMNADKAAGRLKRGGRIVALDVDQAESELAASSASPEEIFDREWRRSVFTQAIEALQSECEAEDKRERFEAFRRYDLAPTSERPTYEALAKELDLPATTITNHLAWARREVRRLVVARLEAITGSEEELRAEARLLLDVDLG